MACATPPPRLNVTVDSILIETKARLDQSNFLRDEVVSRLPTRDASFDNVIRPLVDDANRLSCRLNILGSLLAGTSPELLVRTAAQKAQALISSARTTQLIRSDVAELIGAVHQQADDDGELDAQDRHLVFHMHNKTIRSGAKFRDSGIKKRFREVQSEIGELEMAAIKTLTDGGSLRSLRALRGIMSPMRTARSLPCRPTCSPQLSRQRDASAPTLFCRRLSEPSLT